MAGCQRDGLSPEQRAVRAAATGIIDKFVSGDYASIVASMPYADSFSDGYRRQLAELMAEHSHREAARCGGVARYEIRGDTLSGDEAQVFVMLHFSDSTAEEISLPLTRIGGEWKLR